MNINKFISEKERFELTWNDEAIWFDAKKASLTPDFIKQIGSVVSYPKAVAMTVSDWNVFWDEAEAHKVALEEEELAKLPVPFLDAVLSAITNSWSGDEKKPEGSQNGLAAKAK